MMTFDYLPAPKNRDRTLKGTICISMEAIRFHWSTLPDVVAPASRRLRVDDPRTYDILRGGYIRRVSYTSMPIVVPMERWIPKR